MSCRCSAAQCDGRCALTLRGLQQARPSKCLFRKPEEVTHHIRWFCLAGLFSGLLSQMYHSIMSNVNTHRVWQAPENACGYTVKTFSGLRVPDIFPILGLSFSEQCFFPFQNQLAGQRLCGQPSLTAPRCGEVHGGDIFPGATREAIKMIIFPYKMAQHVLEGSWWGWVLFLNKQTDFVVKVLRYKTFLKVYLDRQLMLKNKLIHVFYLLVI